MITNGIKPLSKLPKRKFHQYFGASSSIPVFSLDVGLWEPNQNGDNKPTECTSYFISKTLTDYKKKLYAPGFSYGATMFTEGVIPTTAGANPLAALQSAVICGVLPAPFAFPVQTEIEDANWNNWNATQRQVALSSSAVDVHNALGYTDAFTSILSTVWTGQVAVALCTPFYREWEIGTGSDGIMPMPDDVNDIAGLPWHCYSGLGQDIVNGKSLIETEVWIGPSWGKNGKGFLSQDIVNAVMAVPGAGALVLIMAGNRWLPLCRIVVTRPQTIAYAWPRILQVTS